MTTTETQTGGVICGPTTGCGGLIPFQREHGLLVTPEHCPHCGRWCGRVAFGAAGPAVALASPVRALVSPPTAAAPGAGETREHCDWPEADTLTADYRREMAAARTLRDARAIAESMAGCLDSMRARIRDDREKLRALAALTPEVVAAMESAINDGLHTLDTKGDERVRAGLSALAALARRPGGTEVG